MSNESNGDQPIKYGDRFGSYVDRKMPQSVRIPQPGSHFSDSIIPDPPDSQIFGRLQDEGAQQFDQTRITGGAHPLTETEHRADALATLEGRQPIAAKPPLIPQEAQQFDQTRTAGGTHSLAGTESHRAAALASPPPRASPPSPLPPPSPPGPRATLEGSRPTAAQQPLVPQVRDAGAESTAPRQKSATRSDEVKEKAPGSTKTAVGSLLKYIGKHLSVPIVVGALIGFAAGGPAGAVVGAGVGFLAYKAARGYTKTSEKKHQAASSVGAAVDRGPERSEDRSLSTSSRAEENNVRTAGVERERSLQRGEQVAGRRETPIPANISRNDMAAAASMGLDGRQNQPVRGDRNPGNVAAPSTPRGLAAPTSPARRTSR